MTIGLTACVRGGAGVWSRLQIRVFFSLRILCFTIKQQQQQSKNICKNGCRHGLFILKRRGAACQESNLATP